MDTLSLAMILKNEAETIEQVIKSFWKDGKPLYQELVVGLDNSTTDDTEKKILPYAHRIVYFDWEKDFSKARNKVLDYCTKDWIFMPDGHEFLTKDSQEAIIRILSEDQKSLRMLAPYIGMYDGKRCCPEGCGPAEFPAYVFPRPIFFVNDPAIRFHEPAHNYLVDETGETFKLIPEIRLEHRQSEARFQERKAQRFEMNLPIFKHRAELDPDDPRAFFYQAISKSEFEGGEVIVKEYEEAIAKSKNDDQRSQIRILLASLLCEMAEAWEDVKYFERARLAILPALGEGWFKGEPYFLLAWIAYGMGNPEEAAHWAGIVTGHIQMPMSHYFVSPEAYFVYPWDILANANRQLGKWDSAVRAAKELCRWKPNCKTAKKFLETVTQEAMLNGHVEPVFHT